MTQEHELDFPVGFHKLHKDKLFNFTLNRCYDVVGFEGPGQGGALFKGGLAFDYRWERPVAAILDHMGLEDVTLFGLSLGGWLCLRAAAHEPRIERVIACGGTADYLEIIPAAIRWMFTFFTRYENFFDKSARWKMKKNPRMRWEIGNTMHITRTDAPLLAYHVHYMTNGPLEGINNCFFTSIHLASILQ